VSPFRSGGRSAIGAAAALVALAAALAGCGATLKGSPARASGPMTCPEVVLGTLGRVVRRVYHEGVTSERTLVARRMIRSSPAVREALSSGDARTARAAAQALIATGHLERLELTRGGRPLAAAGGSALAPLRGTITDAIGRPLGTYLASVWSDRSFRLESEGIAGGEIALRERGRSVGGSFPLPAGSLPAAGTIRHGRAVYDYTSFPAEAYPSGVVRVYLLKRASTIAPLCGASSEETITNTLAHVARVIYAGEVGAQALAQARRVQGDGALLSAVARRDPAASKLAAEHLLNHHIVRLRVSTGGRLLTDVGGPYVLGPVRAPLRLHGRAIGEVVLSVQDDEGYLRLAKRLAGLDVLIYARSQLVKNSLGPEPGSVPASGDYGYRGRNFEVITVHATAFPSGPLPIRVLIPIPYS
jgi:hypothetical protein